MCRIGIWSTVLRVVCVSALIVSCASGIAAVATNDLTTLLQRGLFEEEANRNLDAAIASYDALAKQFDRNRQIAATAIFRLGECYRKLGRTNDAVQHYERILREFSDQQTLATLSRQNLAGMGKVPAVIVDAAAEPSRELSPEAEELARTEKILAQLRGWSLPQLRRLIPTLVPDAEFERLNRRLEMNERFGDNPANPQTLEERVELSKALDYRAQQILVQLRERAAELRQAVAEERPTGVNPVPGAPTSAAILDDEDKEIRRIEAMIRNSPDLINAPGGETGLIPLAQAASNGYLRVAEFLLNNGAEINRKSGPQGRTPLHHAVQNGHLKMAELLISRGADVNATASGGETPLYLAVECRFPSLIDLLLKSNADPNRGASRSTSRLDETPLMIAVRDGVESIVATLLAHGADPNRVNRAGEGRSSRRDSRGECGSALHMAAARVFPRITALLLTNGASVKIMDGNGETPLHVAAAKGATNNLLQLIRAGADVNAVGNKLQTGGATPLFVAVTEGRIESVRMLLENGADPNPSANGNTVGVTPLMVAAEAASPEMALLLLKAGAAIGTADSEGNTALSIAARSRNPEMVKTLLAQGADPNTRLRGWPILSMVLTDSHAFGLVPDLIRAGADVNALDPEGQTPLHRAVMMNSKDLLEQILVAGANPNVRNKDGRTPLDLLSPQPGLRAVPGPNPNTQSTPPGELATLLRKHGALDDLPDFTKIRLTRQGVSQPIAVFQQDTNGWNRFTLMEALLKFYGERSRGAAMMVLPGNELPPWLLRFPDLTRIIIHRPGRKPGEKETLFHVNLLADTNRVDCSKNVPLEFGDVVEVPVREFRMTEMVVGGVKSCV